MTTNCACAPTRLAVAAAVAAIASAVLLAGCEEDSPNAYAPPPPPVVFVATPVEREVVNYLTYTGVVEASQTVELRARVQGFLDEVKFQPGQKVTKDQVLFQLDPRQYEAAVEKAKAEVRARKAALVGATNDAKLAQELADQRAGPAIDAVIKAARRDAYAADVAQAEAALEEAELNLEYCTVYTPIAGKIGRNLVDVGNLVGRSEPTLLAEVVLATPAYVSIDVSESDVLMIRRDHESARKAQGGAARDPSLEAGQIAPDTWQPCELGLADEEEFAHQGRVDYVAPQLSTDTGTLRVRTRWENADDALIPGLFVRVRFPLSKQKRMLVPEAALLRDQEGRYAMVVNASNEVEVKRVEIGVLDGSMREVAGGLTLQDRVIVLGVMKARPGAKVTPQVQQEEAAASR